MTVPIGGVYGGDDRHHPVCGLLATGRRGDHRWLDPERGHGAAHLGGGAGDTYAEAARSSAASSVSAVVTWLYYALMESSARQATLGKMALGIIVTDIEGRRIGFGKATGRHFAKILSALILGIGFLMVAFTQRKQGLHDILAGTLVIRGQAPSVPSVPPPPPPPMSS